LAKKDGYWRFVEKLGDKLWDVEAYRVCQNGSKPRHIAVAILADGTGWVGTARCSEEDQYSRKKGHELAVKRALVRAVKGPEYDAEADLYPDVFHLIGQRGDWPDDCEMWRHPDFELAVPIVEGIELRDKCREECVRLGVM
jgi:hypothetical protein